MAQFYNQNTFTCINVVTEVASPQTSLMMTVTHFTHFNDDRDSFHPL